MAIRQLLLVTLTPFPLINNVGNAVDACMDGMLCIINDPQADSEMKPVHPLDFRALR